MFGLLIAVLVLAFCAPTWREQSAPASHRATDDITSILLTHDYRVSDGYRDQSIRSRNATSAY